MLLTADGNRQRLVEDSVLRVASVNRWWRHVGKANIADE